MEHISWQEKGKTAEMKITLCFEWKHTYQIETSPVKYPILYFGYMNDLFFVVVLFLDVWMFGSLQLPYFFHCILFYQRSCLFMSPKCNIYLE